MLIADASYSVEHANKILETIIQKLEPSATEYKRILKTLNLLEFLIKNGSVIFI